MLESEGLKELRGRIGCGEGSFPLTVSGVWEETFCREGHTDFFLVFDLEMEFCCILLKYS